MRLQVPNKAEYWFLDLVIKCFWPLADLEAEYLEIEANRPGHGLGHAELVQVLSGLFQRGDLTAYRIESWASGSSPTFTPSTTEIESALAGKDKIFFGLTQQGGARWEAVSRPNWNRYISISSNIKREGEVICSDKSLILEEMKYHTVVPDSQEWDVLQPWKATYWKTLPLGHRLRYRYTYHSESPPKKTDEEFREWISFIAGWYTNPWRS